MAPKSVQRYQQIVTKTRHQQAKAAANSVASRAAWRAAKSSAYRRIINGIK